MAKAEVITLREAWDGEKGRIPPGPPGETPPEDLDPWFEAPFSPLGKAGNTYWFLDRAGDLVEVAVSRFSAWPSLVSLCGGQMDWLKRHWPRFDKDGVKLNGFSVQEAGAAIMARCAAMPSYDPDEPQRRYGAWPWADGGVALHLGDQVIINGQSRPSGFRDFGALWVRQAPRPAPREPAPVEIGKEFETLLAGWNWRSPHGPSLILGVAVVAALAGLLPWRAHAIVVGSFGSGKTSLLRALTQFCPLLRYQNQFTEPGVRRMLSDSAAGLILDEAESDASGESRLTRIIEMLRRASSAGGLSQVMGGGNGGGVQHFTVTSNAILGCTLPPALTPQDTSRFTVLNLDAINGVGGDVKLTEFLHEHGLSLWGRAMAEAPRVLRIFSVLRARIVERGFSTREGDQLGIIAACRWVMVMDAIDDPPFDDPAKLDDPLEIIGGLLSEPGESLHDSGGGQALRRLLSTPIDSASDRNTIGHSLRKIRRSSGDIATVEKHDAILQAHGMRWATFPLKPHPNIPAPHGLYVATEANPRLLKAFDGTPWAGQRWSAALAQLPDALSGRMLQTVRIGGVKSRVVWVADKTISLLTDDDADLSKASGFEDG